MDATAIDALRTFRRMATVIANLPTIGAEAYANGRFGDRPIVEAHFTPGNDQRQGWPPLNREYAMSKARGLKRGRGGKASELQTLKTGRRVKVDRNASFQSSTGQLSGIGTMENLPMLVRTGLLRERVTSRTLHTIAQRGDTAYVSFDGLPDYAHYLHTGTNRMPQRSPVDPSFQDILLVEDAMRKYLDAASGGTKGVPVSGSSIGGQARVVP